MYISCMHTLKLACIFGEPKSSPEWSKKQEYGVVGTAEAIGGELQGMERGVERSSSNDGSESER